MHAFILGIVSVVGALMGSLTTAFAVSRQSRLDRQRRAEDDWRRRVDDNIDRINRDRDRGGPDV